MQINKILKKIAIVGFISSDLFSCDCALIDASMLSLTTSTTIELLRIDRNLGELFDKEITNKAKSSLASVTSSIEATKKSTLVLNENFLNLEKVLFDTKKIINSEEHSRVKGKIMLNNINTNGELK